MENKTNNYYAALSRLVRFFERTTSGFAFAVMKNQNKFSFVNNNLAEMLRERNLFLKIINFDVNSKKTIIGAYNCSYLPKKRQRSEYEK